MNSTLVIGIIVIILGLAFAFNNSWSFSSGFVIAVGFMLLTFNKEIQWRFENGQDKFGDV